MNYKILGKTNLKVPLFGFGAIQISRISEKDAIFLIREAIDKGINLIDTAHDYPNSEALLGKALKGIRDKVVISTKSLQSSKKEFLNDLEVSLKRLKTDYIDIFLFHDTSKSEKVEKLISNEVIEALIKEKQKGKINFIGFSCHNPQVIEKFYKIDQFSVLMIPINFISTEFTKDYVYKKLIDNSIGLLGMKPLGGGRITDINLCFKYIRQFKEVIPIVGMESYSELRQNIEYVSSGESLNSSDRKRIEEIRNELGDKFCRGCSYCMPCDQGIDICEINFIKVFYKQFPTEKFLTPERTEKVEKVDDCIECGKCEEKCPYHLNIIEMLKENRDFYMKKLKNKYLF